MLDYWKLVVLRASWEAWTLVTGLETWQQFVLLATVSLVTCLIYLRVWGWEAMKQEHIRPLGVLVAAYLLTATGIFAFKLAQMPSIIQRETEEAGLASHQEHEKRDRESRGDIPLADPGTEERERKAAEAVAERVAALERAASAPTANSPRTPQWDPEKLKILASFAERGQGLKTAPKPGTSVDAVEAARVWRLKFVEWFNATDGFIKKECTTQASLSFLDTSDYLTRTFRQVHPDIQSEINLVMVSTSNLTALLGKPELCP